MGKLRVGDIEIDGADISIGGARVTGRRQPALPAPAGNHPLDGLRAFFNGLAAFGIRPRHLAGIGAAALAAGLVWFLATKGPLDPLAFVTRGLFLIAVGASIGALAGTGSLLRSFDERIARQALERELRPIAERLCQLLTEPDHAHTVEWIAAAAHLPRRDVVRALALLRRQGQVFEDLDAASGNWFYWTLPRERTLDEEVKALGGDT